MAVLWAGLTCAARQSRCISIGILFIGGHEMRTHRLVIVAAIFLSLAGLLKADTPYYPDLTYTPIGVETNAEEQSMVPSLDEYGCCEPCCCEPLWTVNVGAVYLHRSTPQPSLLVETWDSSATLLDAGDFNFYYWKAGPDISAVRRLKGCGFFDAVGFRYFDVQGFQANSSIITDTAWRFPLSRRTLPNASIDSTYNSRLSSAELNLHRQSRFDRLTWLAGFRWIGLQEDLNMAVSLGPGGPPGYYTYATKNNLYGGQVGANLIALDWGAPFRLNCCAKAGVFGNAAANQYDITDSFGTYRLLSADRNTQVAFVGDVAVTVVSQVTEHIALQGGYQLLWVRGAAIAGDQAVVADYTTGSGISSRGGAFYHGAMASVNFMW